MRELKRLSFFSPIQYILEVYSDLCTYMYWALIRAWALVRNIFSQTGGYLSMGAYLSPRHLIGDLRYLLSFSDKGVVIKYLSWGGGGFLRGVCNKNAVLRRGFKQIAKKWRGMKHKL